MFYLQYYAQPTFAEQLFLALLQWLFLIYVIMFVVRLIRNRPMTETHSHQYRIFENTSFSSQEFYETVKRAVAEKEYPNIKTSRVTYSEGTIVFGNREYLRIERLSSTFDICAAPFGKDYFISWWTGEVPNVGRKVLASLPWFGPALASAMYGKGLYILDAEVVFRDSVNQIIEDAVAAATNGRGVRSIQQKQALTIPAKQN